MRTPSFTSIVLAAGFLTGASIAANAQDKLKAVTTFTVIADMAKNVAGDAAIVESITKPGAEIHNYQPTPRDLVGAGDADLILANGLGLERWFERFLANLGDIPTVIVSEGVEPMGISEGPYDGKPNPHAWMSLEAAKVYVDNIAEGFAAEDPQNAGTYRANAENYKGELEAAIGPIRDQLAAIPDEKRWLATSEGAFTYLARDFDLKELYLWPINADQQGTPQQVRKVIDTIESESVPCIFSESTVSAKPAEQVARETNADYGGVLYVDSLSDAGGPVPTYIDLIKTTSKTIAECLSK